MTRILFLVNNYPPHRGGVETHVSSLAEYLVSLGAECMVVTIADTAAVRQVRGVTVLSVRPQIRIGEIFAFPRLGVSSVVRRLIQTKNFDVISVHTRFFPMTWIGVKVGRSAKLPVLLTEHGSDHVVGVSVLLRILSIFVDMTLGRWSLRHASERLGVSNAAQAFILRLSGRHAKLFLNAISIQDWKPTLWGEQARLVFVGRLVPKKGWLEAINVFNQIATRYPKLQLDIFGEGPSERSAKMEIAASAFRDRIKLHGHQEREVIRDALTGAVLLNATSLSEGFQTTLIEAMVAGAKIVTYPTPGVEALMATGAQIWLTQNLAELVSATQKALESQSYPIPDSALEEWDWKQRARDFFEIVSSVQSRSGVASSGSSSESISGM